MPTVTAKPERLRAGVPRDGTGGGAVGNFVPVVGAHDFWRGAVRSMRVQHVRNVLYKHMFGYPDVFLHVAPYRCAARKQVPGRSRERLQRAC